MKVVILVNLFPPKWLAGTEIATYNIAKYLAKEDNEVHVITSRDDELPKREKLDNFFVHRVGFKKIHIIGIFSFWFRVILKIKKINPDIVHVQSISTSLPGFISNFLFKFPYIIWAQGSDVYLPDRFTKLISKAVLTNASTVIVLSEDMKSRIISTCNEDKITILPNGIELKKFKDSRLRELNDKDKKTILFVGTLRPVKGINYLIKAMNIIHKKFPTADLLIVGDGPDREKLETLAKELNLQECIHFEGKVSNEEIPKYMAQSDVFVLPSLSESFGIVNIEAMASGLPLITTNVGGLPEIITNEENGFLVEPKNPDKLAEKILTILNNKDLEEKISKNNIIKAKNYSWDNIVDGLIKVYERSCKK